MTNSLRWAVMAAAVLIVPAAASADTIYLCKAYAGGTFWTNGTCSAQSAHIDRIANVPAGMAFNQQVDIAMSQKRAAEGQTSQSSTTTTYTQNTPAGPQYGTKAVCDGLSSRIANYDSMARQPQTAQTQDWITGEKKRARDEQFRLRC